MKEINIDLLNDPEVRKEIERYKWIESEKAGVDIGMERADREWLSLYALAWKETHPSCKRSVSKAVSKPRRKK